MAQNFAMHSKVQPLALVLLNLPAILPAQTLMHCCASPQATLSTQPRTPARTPSPKSPVDPRTRPQMLDQGHFDPAATRVTHTSTLTLHMMIT